MTYEIGNAVGIGPSYPDIIEPGTLRSPETIEISRPMLPAGIKKVPIE